jgi:tetratricopeptide (TPR) repeat protein
MKILFSALCFLLISNNAHAQSNPIYRLSEQDSVLMIQLYKKCFADTISLDDKTTYWKIVNNHGGDLMDIKDAGNLKSFDFANLNLYMRAFYEDALLSIDTKKPFKSQYRLELESKFDPKYTTLLKKNDSLMIQISKENPVNIDGRLVVLNNEIISHILENLNGKIKLAEINAKYLETPLESTERDFLNLSKRSYSELKFTDAKNWIESAILLNPSNGSYYFLRGIHNRELNLLQDALKDFNRSIQLDDLNFEAYNLRGTTLAELNMVEEAIADYKSSIQVNPNVNAAFNNLGEIYLRQSEFSNAIFYYNLAVNSYHNGVTFYNRGLAQYQLNRDYEKVIKDMDSALLLDKSIIDAYYTRGLCYSMLKKYDSALKDFNKTIEMSENHQNALLNRGIVYANLRRFEDSCKDFEKVYSLGNASAKAYMDKVCK